MRDLPRYALASLSIILAVLCLYLYAEHKKAAASLTGRIAALEASLGKERESCETRVAYLKAEHSRNEAMGPSAPKASAPGSAGAKVLIGKLLADKKKGRQQEIYDMVQALGLDEENEMRFRLALVDFEKAKRRVFEEAKAAKALFFEPKYIEKVNDARREAMRSLGSVLTAEQMQMMTQRDYDLRLGLRVVDAATAKKR